MYKYHIGPYLYISYTCFAFKKNHLKTPQKMSCFHHFFFLNKPTPQQRRWRKGLKTGLYYLRTKAAADAIKFTVDVDTLKRLGWRLKVPIVSTLDLLSSNIYHVWLVSMGWMVDKYTLNRIPEILWDWTNQVSHWTFRHFSSLETVDLQACRKAHWSGWLSWCFLS